MRSWLFVSLACLSLAEVAAAPQPAVVGWWHDVPASVALGRVVDLTLRVRASQDAADVVVDILPSAGVEIVVGNARWTGAVPKGQTRDVLVSVRFVADGTWILGASIANRRPTSPQVAGTVLTVDAKNGIATLNAEPPPSGARRPPVL